MESLNIVLKRALSRSDKTDNHSKGGSRNILLSFYNTGGGKLMNRINIICLGVKDIKKSRAFYMDLLGFTTPNMEAEPKIVLFSNNGTKLELCPIASLTKDIDEKNPLKTGGDYFPGITMAYDAKTKGEADAVFARVEGLGGKIVKKPVRVPWGGYSGYFRDLDGYYWEVAFFEGWKFDANDMLVIK
jgi:predicted lactoylglutathione lyase